VAFFLIPEKGSILGPLIIAEKSSARISSANKSMQDSFKKKYFYCGKVFFWKQQIEEDILATKNNGFSAKASYNFFFI